MNKRESNGNSGEHQKRTMDVNGEKINDALREHQTSIIDWSLHTLAEDLHAWADRLIFEFKLECGCPALTIESLRGSTLGRFRCDRNGFGLLNEIAIDKDHANSSEYWQVLGTLLHELVHAEQQATGADDESTKRRNYHNNVFIERAESFGLIVDRKGHQQYAPPPTRFSELLKQHGVEISISTDAGPISPTLQSIPQRGSKLKLWICSCKPHPVRVRVAIQDFQARCLKCGEIFVRK
ncbi:hypothetical protein ACFL5Z_20685 [Planctomycetota bacterium]